MPPGIWLAYLANPHRAHSVKLRTEVSAICDDFLYRFKGGTCGPAVRRTAALDPLGLRPRVRRGVRLTQAELEYHRHGPAIA